MGLAQLWSESEYIIKKNVEPIFLKFSVGVVAAFYLCSVNLTVIHS